MREHAVTAALARSRGALPLAVAAPGRLLLACPAGEAFQIGLVAAPPGPSSWVSVVATLSSGEQVDPVTGADRHRGGWVVAPRSAVQGIACEGRGVVALASQAVAPPAPSYAALELLVPAGRQSPQPSTT